MREKTEDQTTREMIEIDQRLTDQQPTLNGWIDRRRTDNERKGRQQLVV